MKKHKKRLIWQLYPSYLLITLISLAAVSFYASRSFQHFIMKQTADNLLDQAHILTEQIRPLLASGQFATVDRLCKTLRDQSSTRITVILNSGKVIADSEKNPDQMERHSDRAELIEALSGHMGTSVRYSWTLREDMIYVAIPLEKTGQISAVLRMSLPLTAVNEVLSAIRIRIAAGGLIVALLAAIVSLMVSRRISRPIEQIKRGAQEFARGNLRHKLPETVLEEIDSLSETMNDMARQLEGRIKNAIRQRNELAAVLSSMVEGVIAVDRDERIIKMNPAALSIFGISDADYQDRTIPEVIRNSEFQKFIRNALTDRKNPESDIVLYQKRETILHTYSTTLRDAGQNPIGSLIVLNDVTQLKKLEQMRRDFVANVSHEIKTPLTAIKGFVETLQHETDLTPERVSRFLNIIVRHVDRLNMTVEDLLSLSRIEQAKEIPLESTRLKDILWDTVQACESKAEEKHIQVELTCDNDLTVKIDPSLFEQAAINLLDNAIKYSDQESCIQIKTDVSEKEVLIHFNDHGIGIDNAHLPRLFERFYRVDKARSRKEGGTGLGLSIVKHILQAHGGQVTVSSTPGKGSTFTIHLPISAPRAD